jgi:hypothetical protein
VAFFFFKLINCIKFIHFLKKKLKNERDMIQSERKRISFHSCQTHNSFPFQKQKGTINSIFEYRGYIIIQKKIHGIFF